MRKSSSRTDAREHTPETLEVGVEARPRILLADDDLEMCRLIKTSLRRSGYDVRVCTSGINLLDHLGSYLLRQDGDAYALIISDVRMPGVTGMEVLEGLRHVRDAPPIILITAFGDPETHRAAKRFGAVAVLDKPFELDRLLRLVRKVIPESQDPSAA